MHVILWLEIFEKCAILQCCEDQRLALVRPNCKRGPINKIHIEYKNNQY